MGWNLIRRFFRKEERVAESPVYFIAGKCHGPDGQPAAGVRVCIFNAKTRRLVGAVVSGEDGSYEYLTNSVDPVVCVALGTYPLPPVAAGPYSVVLKE